jgi:hypothetical protein
MRLELKPVTDFSDGERDALKALTAAVYPPDVLAGPSNGLLRNGVCWCGRRRED